MTSLQEMAAEGVDEEQQKEWERQQRLMAARVIATDVATWLLQPGGWRSHLTLVGGLDMSFLARDGAGGAAGTQHPPAAAVAALAVLSFPGLQLLHTELLRLDKLPAPYLPGFLGFREVPAYLQLLQRAAVAGIAPQLLLVDGFGLLHPRRCGSACHLGVLADVPTVGVAKHLLHLEGTALSERQVRAAATAAAAAPAQGGPASSSGSSGGGSSGWRPLGEAGGGGSSSTPAALWLPIEDTAGEEVGAALCCPPGSGSTGGGTEAGGGTATRSPSASCSGHTSSAFRRPIYVSVGHRVSLASALAVVRCCCWHRVPEPIRQADLLSRAEVRRWQQQLASRPGAGG